MISHILNPLTFEAAVVDPFRSFDAIMQKISNNGGAASWNDLQLLSVCIEETKTRAEEQLGIDLHPQRRILDISEFIQEHLNTQSNEADKHNR